MARSIWAGAVSVSLISIPVTLGSASKDNYLGLHLVRKSDGSRIKFKRVAEADGEPVEWNDTAKGYDAPDGSLVVLDKADFERAYGEKNRKAEILMFTDAGNIPPLAVKSAYWVQPVKGGEREYALLAGALASTHKVAVLVFAMRERQSTAVLRAEEGYLSLETLEWDSDLVRPDFPAPPQTASEADQKLALTLIDSLTMKYDHASSVDKSAEAVMAVITAKIETGQVIRPPMVPSTAVTGMPADLTAILQASVDAQKPKPARKPRSPRAAKSAA